MRMVMVRMMIIPAVVIEVIDRPGRGVARGRIRPARRVEPAAVSDTRPAARRFFHIDAESVVVRTLQALADAGEIDPGLVQKAFDAYKIDDPTATRGVKQEGGDA